MTLQARLQQVRIGWEEEYTNGTKEYVLYLGPQRVASIKSDGTGLWVAEFCRDIQLYCTVTNVNKVAHEKLYAATQITEGIVIYYFTMSKERRDYAFRPKITEMIDMNNLKSKEKPI